MPKTNKPRRDVHQEVTDKVIAAIETAGDGDGWQLPWHSLASGGRPKNATTGKAYNGINVPLLWMAQADAQYPHALWAGFKQWKERGATIRKGERGQIVVYAGTAVSRDENGQPEIDPDTGDPKRFAFARHSFVWNAAQVDGVTIDAPADLPCLAERLDHCEAFAAATGATIRWDQGSAFYQHPPSDFVGMPSRDAFTDTDHGTATERLYSTLFHELTHWTGPANRMDRERFRHNDSATKTSDLEDRAREELVAELGAAMLCADLGIDNEPRQDHALYLAHWLTVLKRDKKAIFRAAGEASAAVTYLTERQPAAYQAAA